MVHTRTGLPAGSNAAVPDADGQLDMVLSYLSAIAKYDPQHSDLCESIAEIAVMQRPLDFESGLIHADFCADNMIVTGEGDIVVIDNEQLRVGALDYDLARCWCRWPMNSAQREAFCRGYEQYRSLQQFAQNQTFWAIRALTLSIQVHYGHGRTNQSALDTLFRLSSGGKNGLWPIENPEFIRKGSDKSAK
jgi:Ser/Thr protein kinase RdoA (MazF antagonist)